MWVQSTCASSATSASTSTDMWRTDGYLLRFEPCVLPKMSLFPCHHVVSDCVCVQRTLWFQTPFYCYCAHECATQKNLCSNKNCILLLVGGFNPLEKYARQIGSFPQGSGNKKYLKPPPSLVISFKKRKTPKQPALQADLMSPMIEPLPCPWHMEIKKKNAGKTPA